MNAEDNSARIGRHRTSLIVNLAEITAKLDALAVETQGSAASVPRDDLMSSYAYAAARNELASLVKLTERALMVASHCEQPEIVALLAKAYAGATAARNDFITRRRQSVLAF